VNIELTCSARIERIYRGSERCGRIAVCRRTRHVELADVPRIGETINILDSDGFTVIDITVKQVRWLLDLDKCGVAVFAGDVIYVDNDDDYDFHISDLKEIGWSCEDSKEHTHATA